jgi:hypothetical protein
MGAGRQVVHGFNEQRHRIQAEVLQCLDGIYSGNW